MTKKGDKGKTDRQDKNRGRRETEQAAAGGFNRRKTDQPLQKHDSSGTSIDIDVRRGQIIFKRI